MIFHGPLLRYSASTSAVFCFCFLKSFGYWGKRKKGARPNGREETAQKLMPGISKKASENAAGSSGLLFLSNPLQKDMALFMHIDYLIEAGTH